MDGEELPAISASASVDSLGNTHVSLVNIHPHETQHVSVGLDRPYGKVQGRILTSEDLRDHNTFDKPDAIAPAAFGGARINGSQLSVTLPPFSVVVLQLVE